LIHWFTHPDRVRDPREAAAFERERGTERIRLTQHRTRAWVIKDRPAIAHVLAAVEPNSYTMIDIEGITREATAPLLATLLVGDAHFISIAGTTATVRIWPRHDDASVDELALPRSAVFERFRDACAVTWINGHVSQPGAAVVALLPALFAELDQPELEIDLDASIDDALALTLEHPTEELEWTGSVVIQFPSGEISTYKISPPTDFETSWRDRVTAVLQKLRA
jgi:hypothetical protein